MKTRLRAVAVVGLAAGALVVNMSVASGFTYVTDSSGTAWGIQDAAAPGVDTGSIRATQSGRGVQPAYTTMLNGYGGIRVSVDAPVKERFDGELMRGFGLTDRGAGVFESTRSVDVSGVLVSRAIDIDEDSGWGRWLDTFTNTTEKPLTVAVAFGGQTGYGSTGTNASRIVATSSGDAVVTAGDTWTATASGTDADRTTQGPSATVVGAFDRTGNWLRDTFTQPMGTEGHAANFPAYVNELTIAPGQSASLLHYVVVGQSVTPETAQAQIDAVSGVAGSLAASPELTGLSGPQICSVVNFDLDPAGCGTDATKVAQPPAPGKPAAVTSVGYDVVDKTIQELRADMESGVTTSVEITQAYLDRIQAYDTGQFGFNAFITVASDALEQARAADTARAQGKTGALLGIPIAPKDLYDTADMPTTNGSLTFEGFRPAQDSYQVAKLREAGAVILGKTTMAEYAQSGNYSDSGYGMVWNAFDLSRSSLGSSGGSAVATATSMAAAALGSQTGNSLYGPSSAASLVTLRGTDGMQSDRGVMPLTWLQDYAGSMARSVPDLVDILNVTSGTDPLNPETAEADKHRPDDWRTVLDADALKGIRIGVQPELWEDPYGTTTTTDAQWASLDHFKAAGAEIIELPAGPSEPTRPGYNFNWEGWSRYVESHPELAGIGITSAADIVCSQKKLPYTRQAPSYCDDLERMTDEQVAEWREYRAQFKKNISAWMDQHNIDAAVYPGLLSEISLSDGGGGRSSFGRRDTLTSPSGAPTVAFPAGTDVNGAPINLQLMGRAWDDAKIVAMAYAFEQVADGHVAPDTAPALKVSSDSHEDSSGTAVSRCVAGKNVLAVTVTNQNQNPLKLTIESGYGTKNFDSVAAGNSGFHAFTTRLAELPAGEVTITAAVLTGNGQGTVTVRKIPYPASNCS